MTDKIIEIRRREVDPIEIEPAALLPILTQWRAAEPEKYRTMVQMICCSAGTDPAALTEKRKNRRGADHGGSNNNSCH